MATKAQLEAEVSRLDKQVREQHTKISTQYAKISELKLKVEGAYDPERDGDSIRAALREIFDEQIPGYDCPDVLDTEGLKVARKRKLCRPNAFRTTLLNTCAVLLHERDALAQAVKVKEAKVKELEEKIDTMEDEAITKEEIADMFRDLKRLAEKVLPTETLDEGYEMFELRRQLEDGIVAYS